MAGKTVGHLRLYVICRNAKLNIRVKVLISFTSPLSTSAAPLAAEHVDITVLNPKPVFFGLLMAGKTARHLRMNVMSRNAKLEICVNVLSSYTNPLQQYT